MRLQDIPAWAWNDEYVGGLHRKYRTQIVVVRVHRRDGKIIKAHIRGKP